MRYTEKNSFPYIPEEPVHQSGKSALHRLPLFMPKRTFASALPNDCFGPLADFEDTPLL